MSIATEISRLNTAKSGIKSQLEHAGVTVPESATLDEYSGLAENLIKFPNIYEFNWDRGWQDTAGNWTYEYPSNSRSDIWSVLEGHKYRVVVPSPLGTRFRIMFTTVDVTKTTENVVGTYVYSRTPSADDIGKSYPSEGYVAPSNGFLIVTKDNTGANNIVSGCYDATSV